MSYRDRSTAVERREIISEVGRFIAYEFRRDPSVIEYAASRLSDRNENTFWDRLSRRSVWRCACEFLEPAQVGSLEEKYQAGGTFILEDA